MEELIDKLKKLDRNKSFQEDSEKNQLINQKVFNLKKKIIEYFVNNRLKNDDDIIRLKEVSDFLIKTCRLKYDEDGKMKRLKILIEKIG